jgi:hypothetical protein
MEKTIIETALHYKNDLGLNVIPIKAVWNGKKYDKKPLVIWQQYQTKKVTDDEIKAWWTEMPDAGIAAVLGEISDNVVVIDCDSESAITELESNLSDSIIVPCAKSISGKRHYYFKSDRVVKKKVRFYSEMDMQAEGSLIVMPPTRGRNGDKYEWIVEPADTNEFAPLASALKGASTNINKQINNLYRGDVDNVWTTTENEKPQLSTESTSVHIFESGVRDENLFHIANCLAKTGNDESYIRQVLKSLMLSWSEVDDSWVESKIKSAFDRKNRKERNIAAEVKEYILDQQCLHEVYISSTSCLQSLQLSTREEKKAAYVAFARLCDHEKLIVKHGDKRGEYKIVDNEKDKTKMDLSSEPEILEVPVKLPLDLNEMCVISPGNICVVSGSKSSGKTAMLMNIAWKNQNAFNVVYLNSEMSETEFKKRMKKFAPLSHWKIAGYKCHTNFEDYIESSHKNIYIIDFLEVHENFYEIAKPIRKIHEKLGDSLCFIGIQMKSGASLGRGGDFSAEKARLYLTMDYNQEEKRTKVTIYDAKEPRPPYDNVRGKWRNVKIIDGHRLDPAVEWQW